MSKGRPTKSQIRQNMIEILFFLKKSTGYDIYKIYKNVYPNVTLRVIYYHLQKGVKLEEFKLERVEKEQGNFSWGNEVKKTYYCLGPNAKPMIDTKISDYLEKRGRKDGEKTV